MRVESQKLHEQARRLREYEMNEVIKMKESQLKRFVSDIVVADVPVSKDRLATDPNDNNAIDSNVVESVTSNNKKTKQNESVILVRASNRSTKGSRHSKPYSDLWSKMPDRSWKSDQQLIWLTDIQCKC